MEKLRSPRHLQCHHACYNEREDDYDGDGDDDGDGDNGGNDDDDASDEGKDDAYYALQISSKEKHFTTWVAR